MIKYRVTIYSPYGDFISIHSIEEPSEFNNMIDIATAEAADAVRDAAPGADYYDIIRTFSYTVERVK